MIENRTDPSLRDPHEPSTPASSTPDPEFAEAMRHLDHVLPIPPVGQKLHAVIRSIGPDVSFADYGGRSEASIETRHLRGADGALLVEVGQKIEAVVISNEESVVLAPSLIPVSTEALRQLREAKRAGIPVSAKVVGVNAGGLDVQVGGLRAFCPVSQIDATYCNDPSVFVGQTLEFRVTEVAEGGRRVVLSRRAHLHQQREEAATRLRATLHPGEEREGTVVRLESFGAFVDLGGIDGMVHVSEISHDRIQTPGEVLKVGDSVRVRILEVGRTEKGRDRISLSIKAAQQDPWLRVPETLKEGDKIAGRVARLAEFGAFIQLLPGIEGLLHVSEIREEKTTHPHQVLQEGQEVEVRILAIDPRRKRISLSMRPPTPTVSIVQAVGSLVEGVVRAHKPFGVFIDLPSLGGRASGLLPLEESGIGKASDLSKRFPVGEKIMVAVDQVDEKGRIRLAIPAEKPARGARPVPPARGAGSALADALRRALERKQEPGA